MDPTDFVKAAFRIDELSESLRVRREKLLRKRGWKETCQTPGSRWLWEIALPDGRILLLNTDSAFDMELQRAYADPLYRSPGEEDDDD